MWHLNISFNCFTDALFILLFKLLLLHCQSQNYLVFEGWGSKRKASWLKIDNDRVSIYFTYFEITHEFLAFFDSADHEGADAVKNEKVSLDGWFGFISANILAYVFIQKC